MTGGIGDRDSRWLLLVGLLLAAVGSSFAPWVDRPPAALATDRPRHGRICEVPARSSRRLAGGSAVAVFLPLAVITLSLPPVVAARRLAYPRWVRWLGFGGHAASGVDPPAAGVESARVFVGRVPAANGRLRTGLGLGRRLALAKGCAGPPGWLRC